MRVLELEPQFGISNEIEDMQDEAMTEERFWGLMALKTRSQKEGFWKTSTMGAISKPSCGPQGVIP